MGRIIGLIGGTCLVIAAWRLTGQQHNDHTLKAGVEARQSQPQLSPRDAYRKGKELYLRGKYDDAQGLLKSALAANSGLTAADRQQATEYLSRTELKLAQRAVGERGARAQSPEADPFPAEADSTPVPNATRTRVERLLAQAQAALKKGDKQEAFTLAQQANQIAKASGLTFGRQELTPAQFLASLQGNAVAKTTKAAGLPEWADTDAPVRTANARDTETGSGVELTGNLEEEFVPPAKSTGAAAGGSKSQTQAILTAARADIKAGRLEEARQKALEAQKSGAAYDLFDDRPELVLADIDRRARTMTLAANDALKAAPAGSTDESADLQPLGTVSPAPAAGKTPAANAAAPNATTATPKQQATKLLEMARADLESGNVAGAKAKAEQAANLNVSYKLFEDRPELVLNAVTAAMAASNIARNAPVATEPAPAAAAPAATDVKLQAKQLLAQAREALKNGQIEEARRFAVEADGIKATYGVFDDRPEIVLADIARAATRDPGANVAEVTPATKTATPASRKAEAAKLLADARQLMDQGQLEEAKAKAEAADKLNVAFDVFADDRPDLVLAAIAKATTGNIASRKPAGDNPSVQTANAQFGQGKTPAATKLTSGARNAGGAFDGLEAVPDLSQSGLSGTELYNKGLAELSRGDRKMAYHSFMAAHQSGQRLDPVRTQRLQDFLRELAPRNGNKIQLTNNQVADSDLQSAPGTEPGPLETVQQEQSIKFDRLRTETLNAIFRAERLREKDPEQALQIVDRAMATVEGAELSPESSAALLKQLNKTRTSLQNEITRQQPNLENAARNKETLEALERDRNNKLRIEQEYAKLVEEFNTLYQQRRYADAEVISKKAKELDPKNPVSETLYWKAKFARRVDDNNQLRLDKEESFFKQLDDVEKAVLVKVGDDHPVDYPKNWEELSGKRKGKYRADNRVRSEEEQRIEQSLERRISLHEDNVPLSEVVRKIGTVAGINIVFDQLGLEEEGVTTNRPVTIDVDGIRVKNALNLVLHPMNLGYLIKDEVLNVTSRMRQQGELEVRTYPVADLVVPIPNFAPTMSNAFGVTGMPSGANPAMAPQPGMMNQPFAQVGQDMVGGMGGMSGLTDGNPRQGSGPTVDFDTLVDLISTTISPDSWGEVGGAGSIRQYETTLSLVVRQTQKVHEEIADLLDQLRRLQDLQVTVEVRFVTVSDRFFERIGIDFDFNVQDSVGGPNTDNAGLPLLPFGSTLVPQSGLFGGQAGQNQQGQQGGQQGQAAQAGTSQFFTQSPQRELHNRDRYPNGTIVGLTQPGQFANDLDVPFRQGSFEVGVPTFGGFNPNAGVQVGMAVLSDIEAFFFVQAAQGDSRTNLLFAPKVTLFNGQQSSVSSQVSRPFVISLIPTVGFFSTGFQPVIQFIPDGVSLFVSAVISADRRFVRLTVTPFFTNITDVFTFSFVGGANANVGGGQNQGGQGQGQGGGQGGFGGGQGGGFGGQGFGIGGGIGTQQMIMNSLFAQQQQQGQQGGQQNQRGNQQGNNGLSVTVQQPVTEIVTVSTTVSVPDGGTVLLGGIKRLREGRNMSGVPILNKIPYVSRLFKNTGVGRETESVMLMVTPRIIIQEEEEELLGIPTE